MDHGSFAGVTVTDALLIKDEDIAVGDGGGVVLISVLHYW